MLGIQKLKELLKVGLNFGQKVAKNLEDKKISLWEGIGLVPDIFALIGVVKTWSDVQAEINELTQEETAELEAYVAAEFDIPNQKVKLFIQHALMQVISLASLVYEFKHIKDVIEPPLEPII